MLASAIASWAVLAKSLILICSSPRASRWALMIIRRYLLTETPGIATGYWKAMKRPAWARSSGAASVMSSPLKWIEPSVTSRPGWPMITLARVDLPEPLGPISAWISFERTSRSRPLRISLSSAATCRLRMDSSAIVDLLQGNKWCGARRERDQLGERRALHGLDHAALDARPEQLCGAALAVVGLVRAQDALARLAAVVDEAGHRCNDPLQCEHGLVHRDLLGRAREAVAAACTALAVDQLGLLQQ